MNPLAEFALTCIGLVCAVVVGFFAIVIAILVAVWSVLIGGPIWLIYRFWPWSAVVLAVILIVYWILRMRGWLNQLDELRSTRRRERQLLAMKYIVPEQWRQRPPDPLINDDDDDAES